MTERMTIVTRAGDPAPGRLASPADEGDRADGEDLLDVLRVLTAHEARSGRSAYKVAREALWFLWEQPRLPRPLIRGKYPTSYPWSPGARSRLEKLRAKGRADGKLSGVIIEHLIPATLMVREALIRAPELDVDGDAAPPP